MKTIFRNTIFVLAVIFTFLLFPNCDKETLDEILGGDSLVSNVLGWIGSDEENMDEMEQDINLGNTDNLPSSVDLRSSFPPIGNQGSYGTCVAWAVGYNLKTFLEAKDNNYSPSDLTSSSKQFSPKDLFWAIPNSNKGGSCNGTGFEAALDIMVSRGIAPMSEVPYDNLGDCSDSPSSSWTSIANQYKLENYRKINIQEEDLKYYLSQNRAIAIGAKLGDNFMSWNSSSPISSDTYEYNGQHAYHAMTLAGYDDSKQAFLVVNSWGESWGNNGYIWVDYDFFVDEFCFASFVATNIRSNPDTDGDNEVDDIVTGSDLLAWELSDEEDYESGDPKTRKITYNVFNSGSSTINANQDWNIIYAYYDAYDANNFGILLFDYYSDDYGSYGEDGSFDDIGEEGDGISGNWWNHINVESGKSVAEALYDKDEDSRFHWGYDMPNITGYYYLVLIADGYDAISEEDETNNYFFFKQDNGDPISIDNGIIDEYGISKKKFKKSVSKPKLYDKSPENTSISKRNVNAYSHDEIKKLIKFQKENGILEKKVKEFLKKKSEVHNKKKF